MRLSEALAKNLRHYRKTVRKMSQDELAQRSSVSRNTIALYESGDAGASFDTIARLATALGVEEVALVYSGSPPAPTVVQHDIDECLRRVSEVVKSR